ncbi:MAG: family 78 glycoside hydrolase catalytic domain [Clostridiales bacterium]|nr:family 78 glycoside hydrolase catalytic domain [Clostridiales bacterium]
MKNEHWIQANPSCESPLFRRSFRLQEMPVSAEIQICGLGYFQLYVNGKRAGDQEFMPALTNYTSVLGCETTYPVWEERETYRCLYMTFDLLTHLQIGENVIGIQLGNGWYHQTMRVDEGKFIFGFPKLRYEFHIVEQNGNEIFMESDRETLWKPSELTENNLFYGETHDLRLIEDNWCTPGGNLSGWKPSQPTHAPETRLEEQKCPPDRILRSLCPKLLKKSGEKSLYDCGENISGWVTIRCLGKTGEKIRIRYSEELTEDGHELDFESAGGERQIQQECYICDGAVREVHPKFCWHSFRYFEVEGPGEVEGAYLVCTDVSVTSTFRCSDPVLNWLYDAYIRTQIDNYHNCIPSDCPHREKLGYTGDGQLTAETAMLLLDTKQLYEKWYQDILDSQGADTGHIPHTAPFLGGGGGPGGWGGAVYIVPMSYYKIYGNTKLLEKGYVPIIRWLEYMQEHCVNGLVSREEEGGWCLGEWCAPEADREKIPESFVNTYYYILGLKQLRKAADILQRTEPEWLEDRIKFSQNAFLDTYFDEETGDFCKGIGAANAFALNLELGDERTREHLISRYRELGRMDTGIFGTPVLVERLFKEGQGDLALQMLTNDSQVSFAWMMKNGATTLWEKWEGTESHNHPMFGSVVRLLFTEVLGIRRREDACGFSEYVIKPAEITALEWAEGSIKTNEGIIRVRWEKDAEGNIRIM